MARLRIPEMSSESRLLLEDLATSASTLAEQRRLLIHKVHHRLRADLSGPDKSVLNGNLTEWWSLDFSDFSKEVKKSFGTTIPVGERDDWEEQLQIWKKDFFEFTQHLIRIETSINQEVYRLFEMDEGEQADLERYMKSSAHFYELGSV